MEAVKLLVLIMSILVLFPCGLKGTPLAISGTPYSAYSGSKNQDEALLACQNDGFAYLARIDKNSTQFMQAKRIYNVSLGVKYWTDLRVKGGGSEWTWSDGSKVRPDRDLYQVVDNDEVTATYDTFAAESYCFLLTNSSKLEVANCTDNNGYICERVQGTTTQAHLETTTSVSDVIAVASSTIYVQPTITTATPVTTTTATQSTPETPVLTSQHQSRSVTLVHTTLTTSTKTLSTVTHSSSISTATPMIPERQIQEYFTKMKELNEVKEDSLQIAVNATSSLLTNFRENRFPKTPVNLLSVVQLLEHFAAKYAMIHFNTSSNSTRTTINKAFVITVQKLNAGHKNDVTFPSDDNGKLPSDDRKETIVLPAELFEKGDTVIVGLVYSFLHELLPDESHILLDGRKLKKTRLGTRIIACSVVPRHLQVLHRNVTVLFTLQEPAKAEDTPYCVFWDFQERSRFNGSWSTRGCSLVNKTNTKVVCTCNHLTNFAVLMQTGEIKTPTEHQVALEAITYIGCGLSLLGEILTVITYLVLMNLKQEQYQIRLNLVVSIAIAQIIFLAGIDATARQIACIFVAVSIHYFYLAGFAWMLMEGIYLHLMVVKVFNTVVRMKLFYAFSWGFPCLMVVISLVIASQNEEGVMSYLHSNFCWVSFSNNLVWTFAAPVLAVCLINSVILCRVVYEMRKMQTGKDISHVKQGLKACVVLFPLLGMTWVFGILSVTDAGLVFQYIFTILNSLQGFFIFVMHVLRSSDVRAAYLRKKQKWESTKNDNFPNSRSEVDRSFELPGKHGMSVVRGTTASPDPFSRRHQVSPINSDTRESCLTPVCS